MEGLDMAVDLQRSEDGKKLQQTIDTDAAGVILERYLRNRLNFTKAQIKSMKFRKNGLQVNGARVRVSYVLQEGDILEVQLEDKNCASGQMVPSPGALDILYEDQDLIAVWKEAGLVLHPSHGHYQDTLANRLHAYYQERGEQVMIRSIGRLDRDTEGIVVFARNQVAAARLWKQKETGGFWKEYLAVCEGVMKEAESAAVQEERGSAAVREEVGSAAVREEIGSAAVREEIRSAAVQENPCIRCPADGIGGLDRMEPQKLDELCRDKIWSTIKAPIGKMPGELMKMCVTPDGDPAVTHYQILGVQEGNTLVRVRIETGRTHQIRVHMASIGHPLVHDILYGNDRTESEHESDEKSMCCETKKNGTWMNVRSGYDLNENGEMRMRLTAWRAELRQPFTGELIRLWHTLP